MNESILEPQNGHKIFNAQFPRSLMLFPTDLALSEKAHGLAVPQMGHGGAGNTPEIT